eukprot:2729541-Pyramimonas_sp.AAC.2
MGKFRTSRTETRSSCGWHTQDALKTRYACHSLKACWGNEQSNELTPGLLASIRKKVTTVKIPKGRTGDFGSGGYKARASVPTTSKLEDERPYSHPECLQR